MRFIPLVTLALMTVGSAFGQGAIEKCVSADGKVTYSDSGCARGAKVVGYVERERSVADAAAMRRAANERARAADLKRRHAAAKADDDHPLNAPDTKGRKK